MSDSPFRHPDPPYRMPVPPDMDATEWEDRPQEEVEDQLVKTKLPGHKDNRGQSPSGGGTREQNP